MTIRVSLTDVQLAEIQRQMGRHDPDLPTIRLWVVELAAQGTGVPVISQIVGLSEINVRKWLHRYEGTGSTVYVLENRRVARWCLTPGGAPQSCRRTRRTRKRWGWAIAAGASNGFGRT